MFRPSALLFAALLFAVPMADAQIVDLDPDWKESEVGAPPALRSNRLIALEMPRYLSTRFGIDPDSIQVTREGVVRYVVVMAAPGASTFSGSYEGIRCQTGEFRVYARTTANGNWQTNTASAWTPLSANIPSQHALAMARQGACNGRASAEPNAAAIVQRLRTQSNDQR